MLAMKQFVLIHLYNYSNYANMNYISYIPIDMISVCDSVKRRVSTFYLKVPDNPQIIPFIEHRQVDLQRKLHERFDESFPDYEYVQYAFDDEKELITQTFRLINVLKRDISHRYQVHFPI